MTTSTQLEIRTAEMDDLDTLTPLFSAYREFYNQPVNLPECHHFLFERILNHESVIYIAFEGEQAIGFLQLYPSFTSIRLRAQWILNDLYVIPEKRKQGIATALVNQAKQLVQDRKDDGLALSTAKTNTTAQRLYEALNFQTDTTFLVYNWHSKVPH